MIKENTKKNESFKTLVENIVKNEVRKQTLLKEESAKYSNVEKIVFESFDELEEFINDNIIAVIFSKYDNFNFNDLKKSLYNAIDEIIENSEDAQEM